jgi:hypothetical protein
MTSHFYVYEGLPGEFHFGEKVPEHAACCGRFTSKEEAHTHAAKLRRDFLTSMTWSDGTPLTVPERVWIGVWKPELYAELRERSSSTPTGSVALGTGIPAEEVQA